MSTYSDFRNTWLWRHAFINPHHDATVSEQEYFREKYISMREKAGQLVTQIAGSIPGLTVHDVTHLDALWETASLVSEGAIAVSPAEAFVFGASILLHDSAMSLAAYPGGLEELKSTIEWKDTVAALIDQEDFDESKLFNPPSEILARAIPEVLRQLHAKQAAKLAKQGWRTSTGETLYLIDDSDLRFFYGETIGKIAHSHWWPVSRVEKELTEDLGAYPSKTKSRIDRIKLACLLRVADALHLDQRRAPRFLRALISPTGLSSLHWNFQERLASPHIEHDAIIFTSAMPFTLADADSWWLAYDTINAVNRELEHVDLLLQRRPSGVLFRARRVKGAGSPEALARTITTEGWRPVDTRLRVSDIPKIVETLGGAKLYGDDPTVVIRELIQNSADAIQARRRYQRRDDHWGKVQIALLEKEDGFWLTVEDNGIGMSERVLTGPLIDFGTSFWRTSLATQEFPGLVSRGMNAIGRYGIGFFSVFMIGSIIRVISRRCDKGEDEARMLEFRDGTTARPILSPVDRDISPVDGGTRIEILLKISPLANGGILNAREEEKPKVTFQQLIASLAPNVSVSIDVIDESSPVKIISSGDWLHIDDEQLIFRLNPDLIHKKDNKKLKYSAMRTIYNDKGVPVGRAYIKPSPYYSNSDGGWITIGGLRASRLSNIGGLLLGETVTASRDSALPLVSKEALAAWATEQAQLILESKTDDEDKANCAEIVLECGGSLSGLPIIRFGENEWLNEKQFQDLIKTSHEITISLDGDFSYDEDEDDVHPKEFRNSFRINDDIAVIPSRRSAILDIGTRKWPQLITGRPQSRESNIAQELRNIFSEVWGETYLEYKNTVVVGTVDDVLISKYVTTFTKVITE